MEVAPAVQVGQGVYLSGGTAMTSPWNGMTTGTSGPIVADVVDCSCHWVP
jgi:hypothetical protein